MGILSEAKYESIHGHEDDQKASQDGLDDDEGESSHRLGGLGNAKFMHKDEDAGDRQHTHHLNRDADPLGGFGLVRSDPEQEDQEETFHDQLAARLDQAMSVTCSDDTAPGKHVDDDGDENPPVSSLVVVIEQAVFAPGFLVIEKCTGVTVSLLRFASDKPYLDGKEPKNEGEYTESESGQQFCSPRVAARELEDAVQGPDAVQD